MDYSALEQQSLFLSSLKTLSEGEEKPDLAGYCQAIDWAKSKGVATTEKLHMLSSLAELSSELIPERCVFKLANGWSGKGLMVIDREENNRFFDHITLRSYGFYQLKEKLNKLYKSTFEGLPMHWVIESREESPFAGTVAPISYNFYVINGEVSLISQSDYNFATPRLAFFDGVFAPLSFGQEVNLHTAEFKAGHHVIPRHAAQFVKVAVELASLQSQPFVAVQLLATKRGPVFAGFDFAPRIITRHAVTLSETLVQAFDNQMMNLGDVPQSANAFKAAVKNNSKDTLFAIEEIPEWKYLRLAVVADKGEGRGAWRLSDKYKQLLEQSSSDVSKVVNEQLMKSWAAIRQLNEGR